MPNKLGEMSLPISIENVCRTNTSTDNHSSFAYSWGQIRSQN